MGEARRRRLAQADMLSGASEPQVTQINVDHVAAAVRQVVGAITDYHGADCALYAHIGARLLSSLGMDDVKVVAGSAAWRIGRGDSDVISHAREIAGTQYSQDNSGRAALAHIWIEAPDLIIDFSTSTLRVKARQLDEADGGSTSVEWCPDFIWYSKSQRRCLHQVTPHGVSESRPRAVLTAQDAGVFNYTRHPDIEAFALADPQQREDSMATAVYAAQAVYASLILGQKINVIGFGEDGDSQETPIEKSLISIPRPR